MYTSHTYCPLCNSTNFNSLKTYEKDYLVKCGNCSFIFSDRIPMEDELISHYKKYSRGGGVSPITIKRYNELLDYFERYRKTNKIVDIGCGDGYFLEAALKRGWEAYGTEFTNEAVTICKNKGIIMHQGVFNPANYNNIQFDVVTSFEVIEHINNPQTEIKNIKTILRKDGGFYFTTPNFNSISRYILGSGWTVIEYPEHLCYYTAKTINNFLKKNGFAAIKLETSGISISRLKRTLLKNQNNSSIKDNEERLREKTEKNRLFAITKKLINSILNIFKIGDDLKGFYKKNNL